MKRAANHSEAGFTLIELLVSLVIFSLIGLAGFALVDGVVRVQTRTDQRLDQLANLQRSMYVLTRDFEQLDGGLLLDGNGISLKQDAPLDGLGPVGVRYNLEDGNFYRTLTRGTVSGKQLLVSDVALLKWRVYAGGLGWQDGWPMPQSDTEAVPTAVSLDLTLAANELRPSGHLRRLIDIPQSVDK